MGEKSAGERAVDEDALVIPEPWLRVIEPRRGGARVPAVELLPGGAGAEHRLPDLDPDDLRIGEASPEQAAATALEAMPGSEDELWVFVDAWVRERGIPFAAMAAAHIKRGASWGTKARLGALERMRRHLVAASEADYAEAVWALAALRVDFDSRFIVSYLVPTETQWAEETCASYWANIHTDFERRLGLGIIGNARQLAAMGTGVLDYSSDLAQFATLIDGAGLAAVPAIVSCLESASNRWIALEVLKQLPGEEAFEALASRLDQNTGRAVLAAMRRFPVRALRLLAKTATGGGKSAPTARLLLAGHVRVHPELAAQAGRAGLPEREAELIAELAREAEPRPEAAPETLPPLLLTPPWARPKSKQAKRIEPAAVTGLEPPRERRIDWAPGEREKWAAACAYGDYPADWEQRAARYAAGEFDRDWHMGEFFTRAPEHLARPLLPRWQPKMRYWDLVEVLGPIVLRFGTDAFDTALAAVGEVGAGNAGRLLQPLVSLEVARLMADWYTRLKSGRAPAVSWLTRHAEPAALLLIPDAVSGEKGARRTAAENTLRFLATRIEVRAAAAHYGPEASAALAAILDLDPLALHPRRMPAFPEWLESAPLPQILLRGGEHALPAASVRHVLSMLAISKPGEPYAGLAAVRACTDPSSLAEFCWQLFSYWQVMDLPPKEGWILTALGRFGDDETARRLAPLIRAWPGEGGHQRAVAGLDVLAELGTDAALTQLHQIAQRVKFKALKTRAQEKIAEIARELELTPEQLGDRLVPDFDLDAEGGLWLDYGPRRFRLGFDERLRPFVTDAAGKHRKDLPAPTAGDDAELAAAARKSLNALKKEVRGVAADTIRRLEAAMVSGRGWSAEEFRELFLGHRLVWHLTRRLVWRSTPEGDAGPAQTFRVAEDRSLATVEDEEFALPEGARVDVPHPLRVEDRLAAWGEPFADYEIVQPFAQLGRAVYELAEQDRLSSRLTRFEGLKVPVGRVLGLVHRGWERGEPMDGGVEICISRKLGESLYALVELDPGIVVGAVDELGDQILRGVYLARHRDPVRRVPEDDAPRLGALDPVTASELLSELAQLEG